MLIFNVDTLEIIDVNHSFLRKYGYTEKEALNLSITDIRPKEDLPELREKLKMLEDGTKMLGMVRHLTKDGKVLHVRIATQNYPIDGKNTRVVHIHDLTKTVNLKNEYKKTLEELHHHIDENPLAMVKLDQNFRIIGWSKRAEEKFGYTYEEVKDKTSFELNLFPSKEKKFVKERFQKITSGKVEKDRFSTIAINRSGDPMNINIHASVLRTEENDLKSVVAFIENITPQKRLELLFKNTQEIANIGGWEYTPETRNLFWTDEVYRIHEIPIGSEIDVERALTFYTPHGEEKIRQGLKKAISERKTYDVKVKIITGKGNEKWVRAMGRPLLRNNDVYKITGIFEDITEQKKKENKIYENAQEKEVLLAEIHHRVKNNLAIISGLLELKALKVESKEMKEILRQSQLRIQSMAMIHESLYKAEDFSNLEFSDFTENLIKAIEDAHGHSDKDIQIIFNCSDSLELNVNQAIPSGLIINELVTNAFKHAFTDRNKGVIYVTIDYDPGEKEIFLKVSDDGKGLPQKFISGQSDSLGATLIQQLTSQLDGELTVQNKDGAVIELRFKESDKSGSSSQNFDFN